MTSRHRPPGTPRRLQRAAEPLSPELTAELQEAADRYVGYGVLRSPVDVAAAIEDLGAPAP